MREPNQRRSLKGRESFLVHLKDARLRFGGLHVRLMLMLGLCGIPSGCIFGGASDANPDEDGKAANRFLMRDALHSYLDEAVMRGGRAAGEIISQTSNHEIARQAMVFRLKLQATCYRLTLIEDPRGCASDCWTFLVQLQAFLTSGAGQSIFGEGQERIVSEVGYLILRFRRIIRHYLREDEDPTHQALAEWGKSHPIVSLLSESPLIPYDPPEDLERHLILKPLLKLSLHDPPALRGGKGFSDSLNEAARSASAAATIGKHLPNRVRWELALLVHDLQLNPAFTSVKESLRSLIKTGEALPKKLRAGLKEVLEEVDSRHEEARGTLREVSLAIEKGKEALAQGETMLERANQAAVSVERAGSSWAKTLGTLERLLSGSGSAGKITLAEVRDTLKAVSEAAEKSRLMSEDLNALTDPNRVQQVSKELKGLAGASVSEAANEGRELINKSAWSFFWAGTGLLILWFILRILAGKLSSSS